MGEAGNNGASGIWNENKGLYKTSDGNIEILKPEADSDGSTSTAASKGTMLIAGNSKPWHSVQAAWPWLPACRSVLAGSSDAA